jgi:hypothetical protein
MILKMFKQISLLLLAPLLNYVYFVHRHRYLPRFPKQKSLSEKINYVKTYNKNQLRASITDRIWVRDYVGRLTSEAVFPELLCSVPKF